MGNLKNPYLVKFLQTQEIQLGIMKNSAYKSVDKICNNFQKQLYELTSKINKNSTLGSFISKLRKK